MSRSRVYKFLRGFFLFALLLAVGLSAAYAILMHRSRILPPPTPAAFSPQPLEIRGERSYVGDNWMSRERGIWEMHFAGAPFDMGYAHTRLGNRVLMDTDDYMFREMARYVPSRIAMFLIRLGVSYKYRHLAEHIPPDRLLEIAGQAHGFVDEHGDFLPTFHRMIFYHALHDITQGLEHSPLLGCSAFAAAGDATEDGHLLIGRNFDFEGPEPFDRDKAILFFKSTGKIPFASVAWTGMTGVVTGLSAAGIYISINAARTDDKGKDGIPVEILVREILENARSIDDVFRMVRENPIMVPDFYLVADGKTGESAVIERSPTRTEIRRSRDSRGIVVLTNHALSDAFASDVENDHLKRYLTSGARFNRLNELVRSAPQKLTPEGVLTILRDKNGVNGKALGIGNRNALDAIIATHSVVVDATNLTIWVSRGPHLLGGYVGYDLRRELLGEDRPEPPDLSADPMAGSEVVRKYQLALTELKAAERLRTSAPGIALESAEKAEALEALMPEPHKLIADLLRESDRDRAKKEYARFLELSPPYLKDVEEAQAYLSAH